MKKDQIFGLIAMAVPVIALTVFGGPVGRMIVFVFACIASFFWGLLQYLQPGDWSQRGD